MSYARQQPPPLHRHDVLDAQEGKKQRSGLLLFLILALWLIQGGITTTLNIFYPEWWSSPLALFTTALSMLLNFAPIVVALHIKQDILKIVGIIIAIILMIYWFYYDIRNVLRILDISAGTEFGL